MQMRFDKVLGIHEQALKVRAQRAEVIAANLANADTPGYLAKDLDFKTILSSAQGNGSLKSTHAAHFQAGDGASGEVLYRTPTQPSIDGNTVEEQREVAAFSTNALEYQASLRLLTGRIKGIFSALRGE